MRLPVCVVLAGYSLDTVGLLMKFMWGMSIAMQCTLSCFSPRWVSRFLRRLPGSECKQNLNPETVHWGPVFLLLPLIPECLYIYNIGRSIGKDQSHVYMVALAVEVGLGPLSHIPNTILRLFLIF
jgi:hypothetical protein